MVKILLKLESHSLRYFLMQSLTSVFSRQYHPLCYQKHWWCSVLMFHCSSQDYLSESWYSCEGSDDYVTIIIWLIMTVRCIAISEMLKCTSPNWLNTIVWGMKKIKLVGKRLTWYGPVSLHKYKLSSFHSLIYRDLFAKLRSIT